MDRRRARPDAHDHHSRAAPTVDGCHDRLIFSIPILIEERSSGPARPPTFIVSPLFHAEPVQRAEKLSRALTKLSNELHDALRLLGDEPRHDALAEWTFNPWFEENTLELRLELTSGSHRKSFFLVGYSALDRKLYFSPSLPHLRFEVLPSQSLGYEQRTILPNGNTDRTSPCFFV